MITLRTSLTLGILASVLLAGSAVVARAHDATDPAASTVGPGPVGTTGTLGAPELGGGEARTGTTGTTGATVAGTRAPTDLDPGLVAAFDRARRAAADAGHALTITSGFRTPERQQELLDDEVAQRGSYEEAVRWVFPPERSMHVQGLAIDVGDGPAADWLAAHGAEYGICHTLAWEWWHFEWRAGWEAAGACPAEAQDPSQAPGV